MTTIPTNDEVYRLALALAEAPRPRRGRPTYDVDENGVVTVYDGWLRVATVDELRERMLHGGSMPQ